MKLGVRLESLGATTFRAALAAASRLGVTGIQIDAVGDFSPDRMSETGRKEVCHLLRSHGLELTALHCPMRSKLGEPTNLQSRIDRLSKALSLSFDLGPRRVIIDAGGVPRNDDSQFATWREAMTALGAHASRVGSVLALETGLETGAELAHGISQFPGGGLGVNYDPANMIAHGHDPVANVPPLKNWIVHTHAHDIRRAGAARGPAEVSIGHGDIEWTSYVATLASIDFGGWIVVETDSPNLTLVEQGVRFLRMIV